MKSTTALLPRLSWFAPMLALVFGGAAPAVAATESPAVIAEAPCGVPASHLQHNPPLPRVARALAAGRLSIVVLGTSSSAGAGTSGPNQAFPAQLQDRLAERYPEVMIRLEVVTRAGQTAAQQTKAMPSAVIARKPDLVIWQTGSADAVRATPLEQFGRAVSSGLRTLRQSGVDIILMDMQYGPFSDLLANFRPYRGYLWWVSRQQEVGLLPRHQIMELWHEQGRFDLATEDPARQRTNADDVHACLGELLAWMTIDAAEQARSDPQPVPRQ